METHVEPSKTKEQTLHIQSFTEKMENANHRVLLWSKTGVFFSLREV